MGCLIFKFRSFFERRFIDSAPGWLSGIMAGLCVLPMSFPYHGILVWLCWIPLWLHLTNENTSLASAVKNAWLAQFVSVAIFSPWVAVAIHEMGPNPWPVSIFFYLIVSAVTNCHIPLVAAAIFFLRKRCKISRGYQLLSLALLFNLGESFGFSYFHWNLGYGLLFVGSPISQWADLVGFTGISLAIHLWSAAFANLISNSQKLSPLRGGLRGIGLLLIIGIVHILGVNRQVLWGRGDKSIRVLAVQGNITNEHKRLMRVSDAARGEAIQKHIDLTRAHLQKDPSIDLIAWPEAAVPANLNMTIFPNSKLNFFWDAIREFKKPLVLGARYFRRDKSGAPIRHNSIYLFDEGGHPFAHPYHKAHLFPMGEYNPLRSISSAFNGMTFSGTDFVAGQGPRVMRVGLVSLSPQICYENMLPDFAAEQARLGAELIVNFTNSSWLGRYPAPDQHLIASKARALEVRLPFLMLANSGLSTAFRADGFELGRSTSAVEWTHVFDVPVASEPRLTIHTKFGRYLPILNIVLICLVGVVACLRCRSRS